MVSDKFGHRNCVNLRDYSAVSGWRVLHFDAVYDGIVAGLPQSREIATSVSNPLGSPLRCRGNNARANDRLRHELFQIRGDNPIATFIRDAAGNVTQLRLDWALGAPTNYTYDELNRVTALEDGNATGIFARSHYQYDNVGREVATWRDEEGGLGERSSFSVTNQITNASYGANQVWTGNPTNAAKTQAYNYTADSLNQFAYRRRLWRMRICCRKENK